MFTDTSSSATENAAKPSARRETGPARKFTFDRSFDHQSAGAAARPPERKPVTLTPEQLDALKKAAWDDGFAAGRAAGADEHGRALLSMLGRIDERLGQFAGRMGEIREEQEARLRQMVLAIARKLLPDFLAKHGLQEIETMLTEVIGDMMHEPRLVVRVHESQFDAVNARVHEITVQKAYAGKVVLLADAELAPGDCRVEWADGGMERNVEASWKDIEKAVGPAGE